MEKCGYLTEQQDRLGLAYFSC